MAPTHVALAFDGTRLEVDPSLVTRRGCLRALARQAEESLGLLPGKYSFFGTQGKVDSQSALLSAVQSAAGGVCVLEIREHADGKVMREVHAAMQALEERMLAKMEDAIAQVRTDLEPKVHDLVEEQGNLSARVREITEEALASRIDLLSGDDELAARIDGLERDCLAMRIDSLEWEKVLSVQVNELTLSKAVMEAEASMKAATTVADELRSREALECELRQEMALREACKVESSAKGDCETPHAAARGFEQMPPRSLELSAPPKNTFWNAEASTGQGSLGGGCAETWPAQAADPFAPIPYSSKGIELPSGVRAYSGKHAWNSAGRFGAGFGTEAVAPFAQFAVAPRLRACRSSPLLPPLT